MLSTRADTELPFVEGTSKGICQARRCVPGSFARRTVKSDLLSGENAALKIASLECVLHGQMVVWANCDELVLGHGCTIRRN